jgi:hypothetical protein
MEEVITAVRTYLRHPELHRDQRKWIVKHVCGMVDGLAGRRMAEAIIDFVKPAQASFAHTGVKDEICLGQPI